MNELHTFLEAVIKGEKLQVLADDRWLDSAYNSNNSLKNLTQKFCEGELRIKPKTHKVEKGRILIWNTNRKGYEVLKDMTVKEFIALHRDEFAFDSFLHPIEIIEEEV